MIRAYAALAADDAALYAANDADDADDAFAATLAARANAHAATWDAAYASEAYDGEYDWQTGELLRLLELS